MPKPKKATKEATEEVMLALTRICERLKDQNDSLKQEVVELRNKVDKMDMPIFETPAKDAGLIDGSRRGRFRLPFDFVSYSRGGWKDYLGVFQDLVVTDVHRFEKQTEYVAMSMKFDPVPEGERAPTYTVAWEKGLGGDVNVQFMRQS